MIKTINIDGVPHYIEVDADQTYTPTSTNAQSGVAVAQALASIPSGITEISTQYVRITDLSAGVYKLTYNGTKYLYYNGSTSTSTHTVAGGSGAVVLVVSRSSTTYWHWYYINGATTYAAVYFGYTSTSSGNYSSKALNSLVTTVDQTYDATSQNPQSGIAVAEALATKQDTLVSGNNIKSINGQTLLGSGDLVVGGGVELITTAEFNGMF